MTESEWANCDTPWTMLCSLRRVGDRKFRLFAVACCRRVWGWFRHAAYQEVIVGVERFADREIGWQEILDARARARKLAKAQYSSAGLAVLPEWELAGLKAYHAALAIARPAARHAARSTSLEVACCQYHAAADRVGGIGVISGFELVQTAWRAEQQAHSGLVRDLFGPRRRRVPLASRWLTPTVKAPAQAVLALKGRHSIARGVNPIAPNF